MVAMVVIGGRGRRRHGTVMRGTMMVMVGGSEGEERRGEGLGDAMLREES